MALWQHQFSLEELNAFHQHTLMEQLDIRVTEIGEDYLVASMPVDQRTRQPMGILHGGASVALAESLGSLAGTMAARPGYYVVGQEINANHLRSVRSGLVHAMARPLHIGGCSQVWEIRITDDQQQLVCISRLTLAVVRAG